MSLKALKAIPIFWICPLFAVCTVALLVSCSKRVENAQGWRLPVKVTETEAGLGWITPYKWRDTIIGLLPLGDGPSKYFLLNQDHSSWSEVQLTGFPPDIVAYPGIDGNNDRMIFHQGYKENDKLFLHLFVARMTLDGKTQIEAERKWTFDKQSLFGNTGPNVRLNEPGRREELGFAGCLINGLEIHVVYCLAGQTISEINTLTHGPFNSGVFYSPDLGKTWQIESISQTETFNASVCRTKGQYYYFGTSLGGGKGHDLWFARKLIEGSSWTSPKTVTKNLARAYGRSVAVASDDTVHLCWMDCRRGKMRLNPEAPYSQNYEIAYCQREDSDSGWSKDIILSKGMSYCYAPSISVEGAKIVVAWAGTTAAQKSHSADDPNDIYYVTSRDGGSTWAKLLKVTDGAKDGITSGEPQVTLQNGVIHLFYTQGKLSLQPISPGLTKLNQPPWPIYYQRRPFPN